MRATLLVHSSMMRGLMLCALVLVAAAFAACTRDAAMVATTEPALSLNRGVLRLHGHPYSGYLIERYDNGAVKRDTLYKNGKLHGRTVGMFAGGGMDYDRLYSSGHETGEHRGWYASGARKFVFHFRDGMQQGEQQEWFESGAQYTRFHYEAGHELGTQQLFNEDGTLRANYVIREGRRFGLPGATGCQGTADSAVAPQSISPLTTP